MFCSPSTNFETINNMQNNQVQKLIEVSDTEFWHSKLVLGLRFANLAALANQI
jgi:hypothetical protein